MMGDTVEEYICYGDHVCLYSSRAGGYIFSDRTSGAESGVYAYTGQDRAHPDNIPNVQAVTFYVSTQNRYKLNKYYRCKRSQVGTQPDPDTAKELEELKLSADAERLDNEAEQRRMQGTALVYGDIIQLRHVFSNKWIHVDKNTTSTHDKNKLVIHLLDHDGKAAQLKILPKYKVNTEGEAVKEGDQVMFESIKIQNEFLDFSQPFPLRDVGNVCELNLGVDPADITLGLRLRLHQALCSKPFKLWGGCIIQLCHKDVEGLLCAEGIFGHELLEEVHLRLLTGNRGEHQTDQSSSPCNTFWQLESAKSILDGSILEWGEHVRLRHLTSRMYLLLRKKEVALTLDAKDPRTIFSLHPKDRVTGAITNGSCARIQHVLSTNWLCGLKDKDYERKTPDWERSNGKQLTVDHVMRYSDAFSLRLLDRQRLHDFNFVCGIAPLLFDVVKHKTAPTDSDANAHHHHHPHHHNDIAPKLMTVMHEIRGFISDETNSASNRRALLREMRLLDQMVGVLRQLSALVKLEDKEPIASCVYDVFWMCVHGGSQVDAMHLSQHLDFFLAQLNVDARLGLHVSRMLVQLVWNRRHVVQSLTQKQIDTFTSLLRKHEHHRYLELLGALCVCNGVALPANQSSICDKLLGKSKGTLLQFELRSDVAYVVRRRAAGDAEDMPLAAFLDDRVPGFEMNEMRFFEEENRLLIQLCYNRNQHCIDLITKRIASWDVVLHVVMSHKETIPHNIRALFCDLMLSLFIDVGENMDMNMNIGHGYVFKDICGDCTMGKWFRMQTGYLDPVLHNRISPLKTWITNFLRQNSVLIASQRDLNNYIYSVLGVAYHLLKYGYVDENEACAWKDAAFDILNGRTDVQQPADSNYSFSSERKGLTQFRTSGRFEKTPENEVIMKVKYRALKIVVFLQEMSVSLIGELIRGMFQQLLEKEHNPGGRMKAWLHDLLLNDFDRDKRTWTFTKSGHEVRRFLADMVKAHAAVDPDQHMDILKDLAQYKCEEMTQLTMSLISGHFLIIAEIITRARNSLLLVVSESISFYKNIQAFMPVFCRQMASQLRREQITLVLSILDKFKECCRFDGDQSKPHRIGQNLLKNSGVIPVLMKLLTLEESDIAEDCADEKENLVKSSLQLLQLLTRGNPDVQLEVLAHIDTLFQISLSPVELAITLKEICLYNPDISWRLDGKHVKQLVKLICHHKHNVPQLVEVLRSLVVSDADGTTLNRNQQLVIKYFLDGYPDVASVFELPSTERRKILLGEGSVEELEYFKNLIDLLTMLGKGNRGSIRSFCQNALSAYEILHHLHQMAIPLRLKGTLLKYLRYNFLQLSVKTDPKILRILHSGTLWDNFAQLGNVITQCNEFVKDNPGIGFHDFDQPRNDTYATLLEIPTSDPLPEEGHTRATIKAPLYFVADSVLEFLEEFFRLYQVDKERYPEEARCLKRLVEALVEMVPTLARVVDKPRHKRTLTRATKVLMQALEYPQTEIRGVQDQVLRNIPRRLMQKESSRRLDLEELSQAEELAMNARYQIFIENLDKCVTRCNTLGVQLETSDSHLKGKEYVTNQAEALPLQDGYQQMVRFVLGTKLKDIYDRSSILKVIIRHLGNLAKREHCERFQDIDVQCLQMLRTVLYNLIVQVPPNWREMSSKWQRKVQAIQAIQDLYASEGLVATLFNLLKYDDDTVAREVLATFCCLLFNANPKVQEASLQYFQDSKECVFFAMLKEHFNKSTLLSKEWKSKQAQRKSRTIEENKSTNRKSTKEKESSCCNCLPLKTKPKDGSTTFGGETYEPLWEMQAMDSTQQSTDVDYDDVFSLANMFISSRRLSSGSGQLSSGNGTIELVLKLLATLCDGQHMELQNHLRCQPDSPCSINVVELTSRFLGILCGSLNANNYDLVLQTFNSLAEITQGNRENRMVALNHKVVDQINLVLRMDGVEGCSHTQVLQLYGEIAHLMISLIEERTPSAVDLQKEVASILDVYAIGKALIKCYNALHIRWWTRLRGKKNRVAPEEICVRLTRTETERVRITGRKFYMVYARMHDATDLHKRGFQPDDDMTQAISYFGSSVLSVEIAKDSVVHKIYFHKSEKSNIREEMKEAVKWKVDRSSQGNKLRDFLSWSQLIIQDMKFSRKLMAHLPTRILVGYWVFWNYLVIFLSLAINVIMLVVCEAPGAALQGGDGVNSTNGTGTLKSDSSIVVRPVVTIMPHYDYVFNILAVSHNIISALVIVSFYLSNNVRLPYMGGVKTRAKRRLQKLFGCLGEGDRGDEEEPVPNHGVNVLGIESLYYIMFMAASVGGTFYFGYLFSFHMLHIISINELLRHVLRAVTLNARSLIWVAVLGLVVLYIYSVIGFVLFRTSFIVDEQLFCSTLYECSVTLIRYGLIGDISEKVVLPADNINFISFVYITLYQVLFFVIFTTILLNIIFGIIVDTFSELRDLKWRTEKDMMDGCFICGRSNYEFEHYSKGFLHHTTKEHSMWSYIYYFLYLEDTNPKDYTALDSYVASMLVDEQTDFFPVNRALSLSQCEGDQQENRMDALTKDINRLVQTEQQHRTLKNQKKSEKSRKRWRRQQLSIVSSAGVPTDEI